jgi:hypothetical protein
MVPSLGMKPLTPFWKKAMKSVPRTPPMAIGVWSSYLASRAILETMLRVFPRKRSRMVVLPSPGR